MRLQSLAVRLSEQRWLPYKTRRSLIKRLHPGMLKDFPFETDFFDAASGLRFRGNIVNYIDRLVYFCGAHEKFMLAFLRDYVNRLKTDDKSPVTFLDIGANAGNHTIFMAKCVDKVHAFEPFERVRMQLEAHLALNALHNVTVHPCGLSNEATSLPFYAAPESNLGAASFCRDFTRDNYYLGDMRLKRGDDVVAAHAIGKVDIIKADVEGFETFVLSGLKQTIQRDRPLIIIELSAKTRENVGSAQAFAALFPQQYRFYYFAAASYDTGRYRLAPFDYALTPKIQDVIACPQEKLMHVGGIKEKVTT
jgi:FkbM family methyltransferase